MKMKAINWNEEDAGVTFTYEDIPADMQELAEEWHQNLIESAAEASEELMEKYLGGEELTEEEIKTALRQRVLNNEIILVTCGSAFKNKGVQAMLDAVVDYLPSRSTFLRSTVSWTMVKILLLSVTLAMMSRLLLWHSKSLPTRSWVT